MNIPAPLSKRQYEYFRRCFDSWFNVAEGGKRGGKNVLQTLVFCSLLEMHKNKIHLVAGVSVATAKLNILDCDGYGLLNYFEGRCREGKYKDRDCVYVQTKTGEKVVLVSGGGKDGDEKLIKGNTYGMAYVTEANECHPKFLREVFDRTISSSDRKVFHDLNPKAENHWYYVDILDFHEGQQKSNSGYGYNYGHFTLVDNMSLSDDKIRSVLVTYQKDSVWYRRDIRGDRAVADGLVYGMFSKKKHTFSGNVPYRQDSLYYLSIDYGTMNPFAVGLMEMRRDGVVRQLREKHYSGRENNGATLDNEAYYKMLLEISDGYPITSVVIDPSAAGMKATIRKYGEFTITDGNNDVLNGIQEVTKYINAGYLLIHDSCTETLKEFESYSWDDKAVGEDKVIKENDHHMDLIRYFIYTIARRYNRGLI